MPYGREASHTPFTMSHLSTNAVHCITTAPLASTSLSVPALARLLCVLWVCLHPSATVASMCAATGQHVLVNALCESPRERERVILFIALLCPRPSRAHMLRISVVLFRTATPSQIVCVPIADIKPHSSAPALTKLVVADCQIWSNKAGFVRRSWITRLAPKVLYDDCVPLQRICTLPSRSHS